MPSDGNLVVRKGSTITLECEANGNPRPKIIWHRMVRFSFTIKFIRRRNIVIINET